MILLTLAEQQSGLDRVKWAEGLIQQLPATHDGRNSWLLNYGTSDEAKLLRIGHDLKWVEGLQAAETFGGPVAQLAKAGD